MFFELEEQLPKGYRICPNMRIADIIDANDGPGFYKRRNVILPKHVDFLVCDPYFYPKVAVEINGYSHRKPERMARDKVVKAVFADAKIPLEFIDVGTSFAQSVERIKSYL